MNHNPVPLLQIQNVSKSFGATRAVDAVSLDIYQNEFFALLGPSGCGKTTLLRCLAGDLKPDTGTIRWTEKAKPGYCAQDHTGEFEGDETSATKRWIAQPPNASYQDRYRVWFYALRSGIRCRD